MSVATDDLIRQAFDNGAEEIILRVSRYGAAGPEAFQAIMKPRVAQHGWSVSVRQGPITALTAALTREIDGPKQGSVFD